MGKIKNKERSETEYFKGQIRKLESENRQLKKRLKVLEKRSHFYEDIADTAAEEITIKHNCPACRKGNLIILDLKYVCFETCDMCEHRRRL